MNIKKRKILEFVFVILAVLSFIFAISFDCKFSDPLILIESKDIEGQMNTLFQVQASIATLGIALISLLAGTSKEMVFGTPISYYIMQKKPIIFTHKNIILIELLLIVMSYITIVFNYYNTLVVGFILSIVIIGLMVHNILEMKLRHIA